MSIPQVVYRCEVREVFSGDDLVAMVDLGVENLWKRQRIRLHGVDTPPAISANDDTTAGQLRKFVRQLARGRKASIEVVSRNQNSWVVILTLSGVNETGATVNVNELLISQGYAFKR